MEKLIDIFNIIYTECCSSMIYYQDNRSVYKNNTTQYICGRIDGSLWITDIIENHDDHNIIIASDFITRINDKILNLAVNNDDYNQGLYDQLKEIEDKLSLINPSK